MIETLAIIGFVLGLMNFLMLMGKANNEVKLRAQIALLEFQAKSHDLNTADNTRRIERLEKR